MYGFFNSLAKFTKIPEYKIDNEIFRLHYKLTLIILVAASVLVTGREYFGDPIDCISQDEMTQKILDNYCWTHSTFTVPSSLGKRVGTDMAHPGVETYTGMADEKEGRTFHKYYQWVCFSLFFQAMCFYVPRYMWKQWEGGRVKNLVAELTSPLKNPEERRREVAILNSYLVTTFKHDNDHYFAQFVICEVLNMFNVIGQVFFMDLFLGGEFLGFGIEYLKHTDTIGGPTDPLIKVFPRMTKCLFSYFGASGDVQRYDALCILPLNIINEKIYIFLWFWFTFLFVMTFLGLIYRFATILSPQLRYHILKGRARGSERYSLRDIVENIKCSDWFMVHQLSKNVDPICFRDMINDLARRIKSDRNGNAKPLLSSSNIESIIADTTIA